MPRRSSIGLPRQTHLWIGGKLVHLWFIRNARARRYILRVRSDGTARITVPRGGSIVEAQRFAERNATWIEKQLLNRRAPPKTPSPWVPGVSLLYRGEKVVLEAGPGQNQVKLGDQIISITGANGDLRPYVEQHLWNLAHRELVPRTQELAEHNQVTAVRRITVRNQRSRWGSSSIRGTISLNWRLVQAPDWVRDYIIIHELMHLREMNHSARYWRLVALACPNYKAAEKWLNQHNHLLRGFFEA